MRRLAICGALTGVLALSGCGKFFVKEPHGGGGGSTGNYVYVANSSVASIAGFAIGTKTLTATPHSSYAVNVTPSTLAITPKNTFLYAAGQGQIYVFTINSDGSLTLGNNGVAVATNILPAAMKVDATGAWLLAADANSVQVAVYSINSSTGALTLSNTAALNPGTPDHLAITPGNGFIYVSLGTGGVDTLSFNATTGKAALTTAHLKPLGTLNADKGLAVNPAGNLLFAAETNSRGLRVLTINTDGSLTEVTGSPFTTGQGPTAVVVDPTGSYVYVSNLADSTISGFAVTASGALAPLSGSPYATGTNPVDLAIDQSKGYLVAVNNGGKPDLQLYQFDATVLGKLNPVATAATGTDPTNPVAIAATH